MATPFYLEAPKGEEAPRPSFLDRVGTGLGNLWTNAPPEAFFSLAEAMARPGGPFASKLAMGLSGFGRQMGESQKRKGLASAFDSMAAELPESQRAMFQQMVQNDPQAMMSVAAQRMFAKPSEAWTPVDIDGDGRNDYQKSSITGEFKDMPKTLSEEERLRRAGVSHTNVTVNGGGSDKQIFDALNDSYKSAASSSTGLRSLKEAEAVLSKPGIYGAYADERLALAKVAAAFGADPAIVVNTETFRSSIAPRVAALMKETVGSTQISNADREFAEKAAGGSIKLDQATLKRLVSIGRRASEATIKAHKDRLDKVYPGDKGFVRERALFDVPFEPTTAAPDWAK